MAHRIRPLSAVVILAGAMAMACGAEPVGIKVTGLDATTVSEGTSVSVVAVAIDKTGNTIADEQVVWAVAPADAITRNDGNLAFVKEGKVALTWTAKTATSTKEIEVLSPLIGEYERSTPPFQGMRVKIRRLGASLIGEITRAPVPTEASISTDLAEMSASLAGTLFGKLSLADKRQYATKYAECKSGAFAVGLRKLDDIERLESDTWQATSLSIGKASSNLFLDKPCPKYDTAYDSKMTIHRLSDGSLTMANIANANASSGAMQTWSPIKQ